MTDRETRGTRYLLLGHPAWPGNLSTAEYEYARAWFERHRDHHPVYVERIHSQRSTILSAIPKPDPTHSHWGNDIMPPCKRPTCRSTRQENVGSYHRNIWQCLDCGEVQE